MHDRQTSASILVVEDDQNILNLLKAYLESGGYAVTTASDGKNGLEKALNSSFDLFILDVMLPYKTGTELATAIRETGISTPILFLTALGSEADILAGFDVGADDYMVKPFSPRVLLVRLKAILKRAAQARSMSEPLLEFGTLQLDKVQPICRIDGDEVELTPHEYRILRQLLGRPNRIFERSSLIACLYGNESAISPKAIDVHIHNLRTKLGETTGSMIQTVRGFGYKFASNPGQPV